MTKLHLGILAVSAGLFAACTPAATTPPTPTPVQESMPAATEQPMQDSDSMETSELMMGEVREIQVEAGSFYYEPAEIRVKKGETVRIVMNSVDMMHDFVIDELEVKLPITRSGETHVVEFTADQLGEFEYYCSVGQHREQGQVGTLIVEE